MHCNAPTLTHLPVPMRGSVSELKKAGEVAIRVWVQIWNHCMSGAQAWPESFTHTKIVLPGKHCNPMSISDARHPCHGLALQDQL